MLSRVEAGPGPATTDQREGFPDGQKTVAEPADQTGHRGREPKRRRTGAGRGQPPEERRLQREAPARRVEEPQERATSASGCRSRTSASGPRSPKRSTRSSSCWNRTRREAERIARWLARKGDPNTAARRGNRPMGGPGQRGQRLDRRPGPSRRKRSPRDRGRGQGRPLPAHRPRARRQTLRGEFLRIGQTINTMVDQLSSFASEVTRVAREVGTEGKLGGQARSEASPAPGRT